ncbi:FG-GAP repeat domain-containing protein [Desulfocurvibacter africanus]|uniref:FG-GAP repeat domain-containing protein n=1 Tax=Desulfocurvibacter africanus TaxID=873 RepID=UPI00040D63E6|nr:VCBS repeat-containing protein [Desulfocurvibacter africanus]
MPLHLRPTMVALGLLLFPAAGLEAATTTFSPAKVISSTTGGARCVYAADLDNDGKPDVLAASEFNRTIAWYRNTGSAFDPQPFISNGIYIPSALYAADLDKDGKLDVLAALSSHDMIVWYKNTGGAFGPQQIISDSAYNASAVYAADLDGDPALDLDVLAAVPPFDRIVWYENDPFKYPPSRFGSELVISNSAEHASAVFAADLDNDGDPDVLSASAGLPGKISWYKNMDGLGAFSLPLDISTDVLGFSSVFAADLDADGALDVLAASADLGGSHGKLAWHRNNGSGSFVSQPDISTTVDARSVLAADLDDDGDLDVLVASSADDTIAWYENTNGQGLFGPRQVINANALGAVSVFAADLDNDGDLDVLSASYADHTIAWYENHLYSPPAPDTGGNSGGSGGGGGCSLAPTAGPAGPIGLDWLLLLAAAILVRLRRPALRNSRRAN